MDSGWAVVLGAIISGVVGLLSTAVTLFFTLRHQYNKEKLVLDVSQKETRDSVLRELLGYAAETIDKAATEGTKDEELKGRSAYIFYMIRCHLPYEKWSKLQEDFGTLNVRKWQRYHKLEWVYGDGDDEYEATTEQKQVHGNRVYVDFSERCCKFLAEAVNPTQIIKPLEKAP